MRAFLISAMACWTCIGSSRVSLELSETTHVRTGRTLNSSFDSMSKCSLGKSFGPGSFPGS